MNNYKIIREQIEAIYPDVWRAFNPRIYTGVDGWGSSAILAAQMAGCCLGYASGYASDVYTKMTVATAGRLLEHDVPLFWVRPELLEAVARTEPPKDFLWTDMHLPFPAGGFMLPAGTVRMATGHAYNHVTWCRIEQDQVINLPLGASLQGAANALVFTAASGDDPQFECLTRSINADDWPWANLPNVGEEGIGTISNLTGDQSQVMAHLARLALGLLLVMDASPRLVSKGEPRMRSPKPGKREIWTPNILGIGYRTKSETPGDGSHSSPRMHWRRGHFRSQPVGEQRLERKTIWIEPTLVGKIGKD